MRRKSGAQNLLTKTKCNNIACNNTEGLLYIKRILVLILYTLNYLKGDGFGPINQNLN